MVIIKEIREAMELFGLHEEETMNTIKRKMNTMIKKRTPYGDINRKHIPNTQEKEQHR